MSALILTFAAIYLMVASLGVLLFNRGTGSAAARISDVINPRRKSKGLMGTLQNTGSSLSGIVGQLEHVLPKSQAEVSIVKLRLGRAGYRGESTVSVFYGCKVAVPVLLALLFFLTGAASVNPFMMYAMALGVGFLGPDFWLGNQIKKRQKEIRRALPDVLDLLVICIEAGQSLDQATGRTAIELAKAHPALCDEFKVLILEQKAGRPRAETWKNLADRTDEETLRNLSAMVIQAEQFGTSIARTLRVHADGLRTQRVQSVEEQAAKTSVKLVFPLVLFIFPALFLVTIGPAAILMMESFAQLNNP